MNHLMEVERVVRQKIEVEGLGDRIRQAREGAKAQGKSLVALCREANLSRQYWYQLEREQIQGALSEETLRKIEAVLGVDLGVEFKD